MTSIDKGPVWVFEVPDMSCGHCVGSIQNALTALDAQATVRVDLSAHRVEVEGSVLAPSALEAGIRNAGYTPRALT